MTLRLVITQSPASFFFSVNPRPVPQSSGFGAGGTPVHIHLYVEDVDAVVGRALASGAKALRPVQDQFYGDRSGSVIDPYGHVWHVATHKEDLSMDELRRRAAAQHKA